MHSINNVIDYTLQPASSSGSCVVVNGIFRQRGAELEAEVANIINILHDKVWSGTMIYCIEC